MAALDDLRSSATIDDYDVVASAYVEANADHDVSQNVDALLLELRSSDEERELTILDLGCGGGRDVAALARRRCVVWGVDGSPAMCALAAAACPEATILVQNFVDGLDVPAGAFDGVFANASLFHVPFEHLPSVLCRIRAALRPGGVLFASTRVSWADAEGYVEGRSPGGRAWVSTPSEGTWDDTVAAAGFDLLRGWHRGDVTNYYCTLWRTVAGVD